MSKKELSQDLIIGLKEYFKNAAFGYAHRKTLTDLRMVFPQSSSRNIRRVIEKLKHNEKMMIAAGGRGRKGYFLIDPESEYDRRIGWIYYCKLMSQNAKIYLSALPFKSLAPSNQMSFEDSEPVIKPT